MSGSTQASKRRKHLIDFDAPRPARDAAAEQASLERVQRWVFSTLAGMTIMHLAIGLVVLGQSGGDGGGIATQVGLNVVSALFGLCAMGVALLIHRRSVVSPWLLIGLVPAAVGCWLTFT